MTHIYYLFLIVLTGLGSSLMTMYLPSFKRVFKRFIQRFKRKTPNHTLEELDARISNIERIIANRENNMKAKIKEQVEKTFKDIVND